MEAWAYRGEMWEKVDMVEAAPGDHIVCDQAPWEMVERLAADALRLRWPQTGQLYDLTTDGEPSPMRDGRLCWYLQRARTTQEGEHER